ncbi:hypothetical protein SALBM135S_02348 [Streptomyces alboniger]
MSIRGFHVPGSAEPKPDPAEPKPDPAEPKPDPAEPKPDPVERRSGRAKIRSSEAPARPAGPSYPRPRPPTRASTSPVPLLQSTTTASGGTFWSGVRSSHRTPYLRTIAVRSARVEPGAR